MTTKQPQRSRSTPAIRESVERVWLAGLGALALAEEEGSRMFRTLVTKGEKLERQSADRVRELTERADDVRSSTMGRLNSGLDDARTQVLHRLGVPTAREITSLTRRIEALTEALAAQKPRKGLRAGASAKRTRTTSTARPKRASTRRTTTSTAG